MKCIGKYSKLISVLLLTVVMATGCGITDLLGTKNVVAEYEAENYNKDLYTGKLFASDLCVASGDISLSGISSDETNTLHSAALFDVDRKKVDFSYQMFDKIYPASTTKLMTAYLAFKYGNMDDIVTVSDSVSSFASDEVVCNLQPGDTVTLYDLLCGLLLRSGNDCGVAIAEHISGSVEAFAELMNSAAKALGATGSHFVNPHGLHNENHYTTAYDLYLIFNACIQDQRFMDIISMDSYTMNLTGADGTTRTFDVVPTNYYSSGKINAPEGIRVFGGKTGTTDEAGCCVILYSEDLEKNPYISIIMGAEDKSFLYQEMNRLLEAGETTKTE